MTISFGTPATASGTSDTTSGNSITIAKPGDVGVGDLLIMFVTRKGASSLAITSWGTLTGWTQRAHNDAETGQQHYSLWTYPVPDAAALDALPANWTVTATGGGSGQAIAGGIVAARGVDITGSPIHVAPTGTATGSNSPITFAGLTTSVADACYLALANIRWSSVVAPQGSLLEILDIQATHSTTSNSATTFLGYLLQPTAGAIAAQSATWSGSQAWRSDSLALLPAGLVAVAGADQTVEAGELVVLDGSGSTNATTYAWAQTGGGATAILAGAATDTASFHAPRPTSGVPMTLNFELEVGDGSGTDVDSVSIAINPPVQQSLGVNVLDALGNAV